MREPAHEALPQPAEIDSYENKEASWILWKHLQQAEGQPVHTRCASNNSGNRVRRFQLASHRNTFALVDFRSLVSLSTGQKKSLLPSTQSGLCWRFLR